MAGAELIATPSPSMLCTSSDSILLAIDLQPRLAAAMREEDWQQVSENSRRLLTAAKLLEIPVLLSEQYPKGLGNTDERISQNIPQRAHCVEKTSFSCCQADDYLTILKQSGRRQAVIVGMESHVCVLQTAIELLQSQYSVFVVEDAICSRNTAHTQNALNRLRQSGAVISNHESVLFEWLRDARHEHFKAISALIR